MLEINVIGQQGFNRYLIIKDRKEYWTGVGWSPRRQDGLLFDAPYLLCKEWEKINQPDKKVTIKYQGTFNIIANKDIEQSQLIDFLKKECVFEIVSPKDEYIELDVNFDSLKEVP